MSDFDPVEFLERAVRTPSHEDPDEMRDLLIDELGRHGVEATVDDAGNTLATRGSGGPHLVFNTHIDTVPPHVPFARDGGILRGRGSCDAKGPLAAMVAAFLDDDLPCRVTLAVTPDEEIESTGAAALALDADGIASGPGAGEAAAPDGYVVGEPTGLDVCAAARGRFEATITLGGENAHAAEPESGVNAVAAASDVLASLTTFDDERGPPTHDVLGGPTITPTIVRGGETSNQVPAECTVTVDRRTVPPEAADEFRAALDEHVGAAASDGVSVDVALIDRPTPFLEAWATDFDEPLVRTLAEASGGRVRAFTAGTEAAYFAPRAPTVVFGPGVLADDEGPVAHSDREYVPVDEVRAAATALRETLAALAE